MKDRVEKTGAFFGKEFRCWREISPEAYGKNLKELSSFCRPDTRVMAVVKANAYGHGMVETAWILQEQYGIRDFAVACLEEGIRLRSRGIRGNILILGYTWPQALPQARVYDLQQTVVDEAYAKEAARRTPGLRVHLKINTGMNRLGINWEETEKIERILGMTELSVDGIFSHLSMADGESGQEEAFTETQIRRFCKLVEELEKKGICPQDRHLQSSYGILKGAIPGCNLIRPGIFLYGVHSDPKRNRQGLFQGTPALSLKARVAMVRQVEPGEWVGYGPAFRTDKTMRIALLTIGYGDGIPRGLKGGWVLLHGKRAPLVGRICMDQMAVDVTKIPEAGPGDTAVLLGRDQEEEIRAEDLAGWAGTITNELLCRLGERLPVTVKTETEGTKRAWGGCRILFPGKNDRDRSAEKARRYEQGRQRACR